MAFDSENTPTATTHSADSAEKSTYILQIDNPTLGAMAGRLRVSAANVVELALARLYLALFEGQPAPSDGDFYCETRIGTDEMFEAALMPPPAPKSSRSPNLLDMLRQGQEKQEGRP